MSNNVIVVKYELCLTLTCPGVGKKVPPLRIIRIESLL